MPYLVDNGRTVFQFASGAIAPVNCWIPLAGGLDVNLQGNANTVTFPIDYPRPVDTATNLQSRSATGIPGTIALSLPGSIALNLPAVFPLPAAQMTPINTIDAAIGAWAKDTGVISGTTIRAAIGTNTNLGIAKPVAASLSNNTVTVNQTATQLWAAGSGRSSGTITNRSNSLIYLGFSNLVAPGLFWRELPAAEMLVMPGTLVNLAMFAYGTQSGQTVSITIG